VFRRRKYRRIPTATTFSRVAEVGTQAEAADLLTDPKVVVLVGTASFRKWIKFVCPCGCGEVVVLNLMRHIQPCWRVRFDRRRRLSVWPSVRRLNGCRSHFFLVANEVRFVGSYGSHLSWS